MSSKKTAPQAWYDKVNGKRDVQFINYELDKDVKKQFKAWAEKEEGNLLKYVDQIVESGYSFSVKWDGRATCYAAFLGVTDEKCENYGWILTSRASGSFGAIMGVIYRHFICFDAQWPKSEARKFDLDDE